MHVEIIVEGPLQRDRRERCGIRRLDHAASVAEDGGGDLQREFLRRVREIGLRERGGDYEEAGEQA